MSLSTLSVYCGARKGLDPRYLQAAQDVGEAMVARGIHLVYGGSRAGMMGRVADTVLAGGCEVTGVIPETLVRAEVAHTGITRLLVVPTMHERKKAFADLADAFVVLPGGIGTLDELFEAWTWGHLRVHLKPIGILNVAGYYDGLLAFAAQARDAGFIDADAFSLLVVADTVDALFEGLETWQAPATPGWMADVRR
jgi:uncharacterized protein (TIGR00730 family)